MNKSRGGGRTYPTWVRIQMLPTYIGGVFRTSIGKGFIWSRERKMEDSREVDSYLDVWSALVGN